MFWKPALTVPNPAPSALGSGPCYSQPPKYEETTLSLSHSPAIPSNPDFFTIEEPETLNTTRWGSFGQLREYQQPANGLAFFLSKSHYQKQGANKKPVLPHGRMRAYTKSSGY